MRFAIITVAVVVISFVAAKSVQASGPVIFYSDLTNGPKIGGQDDKGAFVTIWGKNFGTMRGSSYVTIGGGQADNYPVWSDTKITFQLGTNAVTGNIIVVVDGASSTYGDDYDGVFTVNAGRIFFVNGEANIGGSGAYESPWTTPASFVSQIQPGDICYFRAGSYTGNYGSGSPHSFWLDVGESGSNGLTVGFVAYPGETVTFTSSGQTFKLKTTGVNPADYITISQMRLYGGSGCLSTGGYWEYQDVGAKHARLIGTECYATYVNANTMTGIVSVDGSNAKILGNVISNPYATANYNNNHGTYVQTGVHDVEVAYNTYADCLLGHVIQVHTDNGGANGWDWENIRIHSNYIWASNPLRCRGITVSNVGNGSTVYIYNNILRNVGQNFSGIHLANGSVWVYNNTFYGVVTNTSGNIDIYGAGAYLTHLYIGNNILYAIDSSPYILSGLSGGLSNPKITLDNNLYFGHGEGPAQDLNAINADPQFLSSADFHLQANSPAVNAGTMFNSTFATDFDGLARGAAWDIGAYEYNEGGGGDTTAPATPANLTVR